MGRAYLRWVPQDWRSHSLQLYRSRFVRGVIVLSTGTAAAQLITIAFSPILTRLYGPEAFGALGVFMATVGILIPMCALAYELAIVLPASDAEARTIARLSFAIGVILSAASALVILPFNEQIADRIGFSTSPTLLCLIPLIVLLAAIQQPARQWLFRKKRFADLSRIGVIDAAVMSTSKTAAGFLVATAPVLIVFYVVQFAFQTLLFCRACWPSWRSSADDQRSNPNVAPCATLKDVARRYHDFPFYRAPEIWFSSLTLAIPAILLANFFGETAVGLYAIAHRVLSLPAALILSSVSTVFLTRIAEAGQNEEAIRPIVVKTTTGLALAGAIPLAALVAIGPWLFGVAFGGEWVRAGTYAQWLGLWSYTTFISVPSLQSVAVLGIQREFLVFQIVAGIIRVSAIVIMIFLGGDDLAAIAALSISGSVTNIVLIWITLAYARSRRRSTS